MHIIYKIFKIITLVIISIVLLLFIIAEFAEDEIASISVRQISKTVELPISYGKISFSLLRDFPHATLEINDIWLGSPATDTTKSETDTLASFSKVFVAVKLMPLIRNSRFDIKEIDVVGARAYYTVNADKTVNIDFLSDTSHTEVIDTTSSDLNISLTQLSVEDMILHYNNLSSNTKAQLRVPKMVMKGLLMNQTFEGAIEGMVILTDCNYGNTNLCLMKKTELDLNLEYAHRYITINKASIATDGANINISGKIGLLDSVITDLQIEAPKLEIEELIKYIPPGIINEYGIEYTSGKINLNGTITGCVSDSTMPRIIMDFGMSAGSFDLAGYPPVKNISVTGRYNNGDLCHNSSTTLDINALKFATRNSVGKITMLLHNLERPVYSADLMMKADMEELKEYFIPDSLSDGLRGTLNARIITKGEIPKTIDSTFVDYISQNTKGNISFQDFKMKIDSTFSVDSCNFELEYLPNLLSIKNTRFILPSFRLNVQDAAITTSFSGNMSDFMNMGFRTDSFRIRTNRSLLQGGFHLSNLHQPEYKLNTRMELDLAEIREMLPDSLVGLMKGHITAGINSEGTIRPDSIVRDLEKIIFENGNYQALFNNVSIEMTDTLMQVGNLSGSINMKNDTITINDTYGRYSGIHFSADSAHIINLYASVMKNQSSQLLLEGQFGLGDIDYSMLGAFLEPDSLKEKKTENPKTETESGIKTNYKYLIKGSLAVNSIRYNKSTFENISGLFNLSDSLYIIDKLKFNAFNGHFDNSLRYDIRPNDRTVMSFRTKIDKIDIARLLKEFDSFDQDELTHEQINGLFSSGIDGRFLIKGDSLIMDSTTLKGDLMLEDGGLFNYKRAEELAEFTSLNELDNIRFKTMESKLFIFNNAIYVPKTDIKSNALNITAYGMQTLGDDYQYHLRLYLGEILHGKTKRIRKKQEAMDDESDKDDSGLRSLYVQSSSIDGKSKNGLDNKSDRFRMQTKINVQEKILNIIFHPLLVDFETGVNEITK